MQDNFNNQFEITEVNQVAKEVEHACVLLEILV